MSDYNYNDIIIANINGNSSSSWPISPPAREALLEKLTDEKPLAMQFEWIFKRAPDDKLQFDVAENFRSIELVPGHEIRMDLAKMINGSKFEAM